MPDGPSGTGHDTAASERVLNRVLLCPHRKDCLDNGCTGCCEQDPPLCRDGSNATHRAPDQPPVAVPGPASPARVPCPNCGASVRRVRARPRFRVSRRAAALFSALRCHTRVWRSGAPTVVVVEARSAVSDAGAPSPLRPGTGRRIPRAHIGRDGDLTRPADPVVSPADTIRWLAEFFRIDLTPHDPLDWHGNQAEGIAQCPTCVINAALAVGERDKAAHLGPVPTDAGGPGKEETYWLTQKLKASIRHLRDIEDYYRPRSDQLGSYNEQRAARARVLYEQITADFLHGKITDPPEIVALREAGERDRRQIARLTEAVETLKNGPLLGILETYRQEHPDDHLVLSVVVAEIQELAAVLAGEEDAS